MASTIEKYREALVRSHGGSPYYSEVEAPDRIAIFWGETSIFHPLFKQLDLTAVVELACSHGRHTAQIVDRAGVVTLVDYLPSAIKACRARFAGRKNCRFYANGGTDLKAIRTGSQTAVFSYDAMVHFELADMLAYLTEISRVLKPGGRALLHYSNNDVTPGSTYTDCPRWRNFGSEKVVLHFAQRTGLVSLESKTTSWPPGNGEPPIDAFTLFEKRAPVAV
jgi:SAM-dependent methyltransferase